jgi:phage gpG-like protein
MANAEFDTQKVLRAVSQALPPRLGLAAAAVEREAKRLLKIGGRGKGPKGGDAHSKPGEPPFSQTGVLKESISYAITRRGSSAIVGALPHAWYGKIHEHGGTFTRTGKTGSSTVTFPARPFMKPALQAALARLPKLFANLKLKQTPAGRS